MRMVSIVLGGLVIVAASIVALVQLSGREVARLNTRIEELEREKVELTEYARRLSASRRVAQVEILRQQPAPDGRALTTVLWQEIASDGVLGRPLALEAYGTQVYFEALVLKFQPELVGGGDADRGVSLALFRRIFGDQQPPETGELIERETRPAADDPRQRNARHEELWARFWELVDDPHAAAELGVRVAQCEAPAIPAKLGSVWEVTVDAIGGVNLRRLASNIPESAVGRSH